MRPASEAERNRRENGEVEVGNCLRALDQKTRKVRR